MKILITHEIFPPEFTGGGEFLLFKIANILKKNGHSIKVFTSGDPRINSYKGVETIRIPINRYALNLSLPFLLKYVWWADIVLTTSGNLCFPSWLASKILRKPICCYVNHILGPYWKDIRGRLIGKVFEFFEKIFLSRDYDAIIFQNKTALTLGKKIGLKAKKIFLIHPGIDLKKYKPRKKEKFILFVGSISMDKALVKLKGIEYLIHAAKEIHGANFIIVGGGKGLSKLKKSPKNVIFKGVVKGKRLRNLYSKSLIFCLPSLSEGFGFSILEAMASGCAIVSTINLGQKGIIIKPKNFKQITNAILYFLSKPKKAIKLGKENVKIAKKFTWEKFERELSSVLNSIKNN